MRGRGLPGKGGRVVAADVACAALAVAFAVAPARAASGDLEAEGFTFRGRLEWLTAAGASAPRETAVNPANRVLALPQLAGGSELRPDLRVEHGDALQLVARPRLRLEASKARAAGAWLAERGDASAEWLELHGTWRVAESLAVSYGLQNFQWGPAELLSPSNRIFHETGFARDRLYVVRGRHLARVNLSAGRSFSAVVLAEVARNDDDPFVAGEPFEPKAQAKIEWAPTGGPYVGLTVGAGQRSRGFFGEYAALPVGDALSLYVDAVHAAGSRAWYPVAAVDGGAPRFAQRATGAGLRTLAVGGVRYTFERGPDVRLEYLFDEAGWSEAELLLAARAAEAPAEPAAVGAWLAPGLELGGRQHAYVSLLLPDLPPSDRLAVQARYLAALEDGSGAAFVTATFDATDSLVAFASAIGTHGPRHGALSRVVRGTATVGAVVSW